MNEEQNEVLSLEFVCTVCNRMYKQEDYGSMDGPRNVTCVSPGNRMLPYPPTEHILVPFAGSEKYALGKYTYKTTISVPS